MKYSLELLEGEKILWESKPLESLKSYFILTWVVGLSFILLCTLVGIILIPFTFFLAAPLSEKAYKHRYYWLTNRRIVYRRGLLGYKITSVPLERISDVILSRTFWENLFGFGSLQIQTLAGQISQGAAGSEADLKAIPDPEAVQKLILEQVKKNRRSL